MAENTKIEWATHTFNPWTGCTAVSAACDHCYAEAWAKRSGIVGWGPHAERRRTSEANWRKPLQWARVAATKAVVYDDPPPRPRVFCASLADVFDNQAPQEWRDDLWTTIEATPELDWLLLTKRPQNIRDMIPRRWAAALPAHIWLGISAEDQTEYERRWPHLEKISVAVRFISHEPALGFLTVDAPVHRMRPSWFISGGEDRAWPDRSYSPETVLEFSRDLRDQCGAAKIPFFFKQTVGKGEIPADLMIRQFPNRP